MIQFIKTIKTEIVMVPQKRNLNLYKCCECGVEFERAQFSVKDLDKAHCGCKFDYVKDWKYGEILKSRWQGINKRTVNGLYKEAKFQISGPYVGVTVCEEWKNDFKVFYNWSIENGFKPHLHIDRIDSKKGYSPDNCRYVTQTENNRNGARSKLDTVRVREILLLHGIYSNLEISRVYGIDPSTLVNICKGVIWNDVFVKYATEKNKVRLKPIQLLPIRTTLVPGTINFEDKPFIEKVLRGNLAFKDGEQYNLYDIKNLYVIYSTYDTSKKCLKNFFDLVLVRIKRDDAIFDKYLKRKFMHNKDIIDNVRSFINTAITDDVRKKFVKQFNNTFKLILKV